MARKSAQATNVNSKGKYPRFGQDLHYLTPQKLQRLWEAFDDSKDKLILKLIFELGCRVGEFPKIQLKHTNFEDCSVFFPAENTRTNERSKKPNAYLFPGRNGRAISRPGIICKEELLRIPLIRSKNLRYNKAT